MDLLASHSIINHLINPPKLGYRNTNQGLLGKRRIIVVHNTLERESITKIVTYSTWLGTYLGTY